MHDRLTILLATTDPDLEEAFSPLLRGEGRHTLRSGGLKRALRHLEEGEVDLLLIDEALPEEAKSRLMHAARFSGGDLHAFLLADGAQATPNLEVDGVLGRRPDPDRLRDLLERSERRLRFLRDCRLLGRSPGMREVREKVAQIAPVDVSVLITGESGTGKSVVAEAIHRYSRRAARPFLVVNCGAIPETLLESELFGHERGAFTDARTQRKGIFETADGGTVFLDEIGEMSLPAQVKLLHVLEEREVTRLGSAHPVSVDVRVIAATNRDIGLAVRQGQFRGDLYYRLNVVEIRMPSLRDRPEDIPELVELFASDYARANGIAPPRFDEEAMAALRDHGWPGNVRELKNLIERAIVLSRGTGIGRADVLRHLSPAQAAVSENRNLPVLLHKTPDEAHRDLIYWALLDLKKDVAELKSYLTGNVHGTSIPMAFPGPTMPLTSREVRVEEAAVTEPVEGEEAAGLKSLADVEREHIRHVLQAVGGNRRRAAQILKIGERTLYRKIDEVEGRRAHDADAPPSPDVAPAPGSGCGGNPPGSEEGHAGT